MMNETMDEITNDTCFNPTEIDERAYLVRVTATIGEALQHLCHDVAARHTEMVKLKVFLHEHKGDMDHAEKITELAQRIQRNPRLEPIERHGEPPEIHACRDQADEFERIRRLSREFLASEHHSLGIICKTQEQAGAVYEQILHY